MTKIKPKHLLIIILFLAATLRLINLSNGDTLNDEALIGFRAIGPMDFDLAEFQTTPLEWFDPNIPFWTKLSFHDHPPLVFWIQHFFIKIFGENNFAIRFPSAILGILSVYLVYKIGKRIYSENAGLLTAFFTAVTLNSVYISRVGLQEAYSIFFMLLASYFLLLSNERPRFYIWTGAALGLALLAKYTAFILLPIFAFYILLTNRKAFMDRCFWLGAIVAIAIFSPVIVYNISMYRAVGHFDFQFSYLFGQNPKEWQVAPGKDIGALNERAGRFIPGLINSNSWAFLLLSLGTFVGFISALIQKPLSALKKHLLLFLCLIFLLPFIVLAIGPSYRFLSLLTPFLALSIGASLAHLYEKFFRSKETAALVLFGLVAGFEIFYSVNNQVAAYPVGREPWFASKITAESAKLGYTELGEYFEQELNGKMPALTFSKKYRFLENIEEKALAKARAKGLERYPALFIYDRNIFNFAELWIFDRLLMYRGWPFITTEQYQEILAQSGKNYFAKSGFEQFYFITPTDKLVFRRMTPISTAAPEFERELAARGISSEPILNKREEVVFKIYKFDTITSE